MPQLCAFSGVHSEHRACSCYRQRGKEPVSCTSAWISSGCIGSVPIKIKAVLVKNQVEIVGNSSGNWFINNSYISPLKIRIQAAPNLPPLGVSLVPRAQPVQTERHRMPQVTSPGLIPVKCCRKVSCHEASGRRRIGGVKERPRALGSCNICDQRHRMTSV